MKVLHEVKPKTEKPWKRRVKCAHCTSTLEVVPGDLRRHIGNEPSGAVAWDHVWFRCPVDGCRTENRVPDGEVPISVRNGLATQAPENRGTLLLCKMVLMRSERPE